MYLFKSFIPDSFNQDTTNILTTDNTKSNVIFLNGLFCVNWVNVIADSSGTKLSITSYNEQKTKFIPYNNYNQEEDSKKHHHDYFELMYVYEGCVEQIIEQGRYIYRKGQVCLLDRNTNHTERYQEDATIIFICFSPKILEEIFSINPVELTNPLIDFFSQNLTQGGEYRKDYYHFEPLFEDLNQSALKKIFKEIIIELTERKAGYISILEGLFLRMIATLTDAKEYDYKHVSLNSLKESFIFDQITNYFTTYYKTNRIQIAKELNYNGDYLNRIVKKHTNMSLTEYNNFICLKIAEEKLRNTNQSVYLIMEELHYDNKSYFYRVFKQKNKCSPQDYRKRYREKSI